MSAGPMVDASEDRVREVNPNLLDKQGLLDAKRIRNGSRGRYFGVTCRSLTSMYRREDSEACPAISLAAIVAMGRIRREARGPALRRMCVPTMPAARKAGIGE